MPEYSYEIREVEIADTALTSRSDGSFRLSIAAPDAQDAYQIRLATRDAQGRRFVQFLHVFAARDPQEYQRSPYLQERFNCGGLPTVRFGIGDPLDLTMHQGDGAVVSDGRMLFVVAQLGSLQPIVQAGATLERRFREGDLPGLVVRGVWLSDAGYSVADVQALVALDEKRLSVRLAPDRARYQPGDEVTLEVTTTGPDGRPIAADVVVRGVDEKLYTLGFAADEDPVERLMAPLAAGFDQAYRSHGVPVLDEGGCGDTGGGRADFRDSVTFQRISTDREGKGTLSFDLPDDLTSWHMTAVAVSSRLDAGTASVLVPVGLPFFVEAVLAPEYLEGETVDLRLRGYGEALAAGDAVRFVVSAPSLGLEPTAVEGGAFEALRLTLPTMTIGDHDVRIEAEGRHGGRTFSDVLVRRVHVVATRLETLMTEHAALVPGFAPRGGPGFTTYTITDAGRGRLLRILNDLASARSARFDRSLAAEVSRTILIEEFGVPESALSGSGWDANRDQSAGARLLPYTSPDEALTAKAALLAPSTVDAPSLSAALHEWLAADGVTREQRIVALAGLAGLGSDVLVNLRGFDPATLTIDERLWLALGLAAAGDEPAARAIERELLESSGQRLGPWVRLLGPTPRDTLEGSALLMLLAARLGDPLAHEIARYLDENPERDLIFPLEQLGYAAAFLDRLPRDPGRFAWTVAGERTETILKPGGGFTLVLTSDQRAGLRMEPVEGELAIVTTWLATDEPLPSNPSIAVTRTVTPAGNAPGDRLVHVRLAVEFRRQAPNDCYRLTDLLPSGLAPVVGSAYGAEDDEDGDESVRIVNGPYEVEGQRVSWCVSPKDTNHVYDYAARVVSPGSYRWEPAVIQSELAPELGNATEPTRYDIR